MARIKERGQKKDMAQKNKTEKLVKTYLESKLPLNLPGIDESTIEVANSHVASRGPKLLGRIFKHIWNEEGNLVTYNGRVRKIAPISRDVTVSYWKMTEEEKDAGGSAAKFLCNGLPQASTDWTKWRVFFCDERLVPFTDPECTFTYYKTNLVSKVPNLENNFFTLDPNLSVEEAAVDYEKKVRTIFPSGNPRFDVLSLGMGPDGHTCSLFPGHKLLNETERICAPISDSPKPPPQRVTLTFPVINNAACCVFASCGAGKADIVQQVLEAKSDEPLPAARVRPTNGEVIWILDKAAAGKLKAAL